MRNLRLVAGSGGMTLATSSLTPARHYCRDKGLQRVGGEPRTNQVYVIIIITAGEAIATEMQAIGEWADENNEMQALHK